MTTVRKVMPWRVLSALAICVVLVGFGLGYVPSSINTNTSNASKSHQLAISTTNEVTDNEVAHQISVSSLDELANAHQFGSFFARTEALLAFVTQANIQTVQQLWEQSKKLQSPQLREEIQNNVIQRWAVLEPLSVIEVMQAELPAARQISAIELVFREWSVSSLEDAINHAQNLDKEHRESAVTGIVLAREDLTPQQRRAIARLLDCESVAIALLKKITSDVVIDVPASEWSLFVSENFDQFQNLSAEKSRMLVEIGHSWVLQDGVVVFEAMQESLPSNSSLFGTAKFISEKLIETHPQLALNFVLRGGHQAQELGYHDLAVELIARWAKTDPSNALKATNSIDARSMRRQMQQRVLGIWAAPDPYALLDTLSTLPDNLQNLAHEIALVELAKHSPEAVVGMLSDLSMRRNRDKVAEAIVSSWAVIDITSTLQWIGKEPLVAHKKQSLKQLAFEMFARTDPQLALEIALQQPLKTNGEGWEREVIRQMILRDMDTAATMLSRARPGETRHDVYDFAVIVSLFDSDFDGAVEIFLNLCEVEPKVPMSIDLFSRLAPERLFEMLEVIRSVEARADVARHLLWHYEGKDVFTTVQISLLREVEHSQQKQLPSRISSRLRDAYDELRKAIEAEGNQ